MRNQYGITISTKVQLHKPRYESGKSDNAARLASKAVRNRESRDIEFDQYLSAAMAKRQAH